MRVLIAPDKFRGTLTAAEASRAIAAGWSRARPADQLTCVPMADGGEGTLDALIAALGGEKLKRTVSGPLGDRLDAEFGLVQTASGSTGVVEMARASGLALISEARRDPKRTTTFGTGELILAATDHRPARIVVCIGGSATNDGGAGMAQALGARLLDRRERQIAPGGAALSDLARIDQGSLPARVSGTRFLVASDVDNPLTGPMGASAVYGPQKGATPEDVEVLDRALRHLAAVVARDLGVDLRDEPGAGAAGGLGFGLMAFCAAELRPGVEVVMDAVGLHRRLASSDLVITGEGSFDEGSLHGKVPAGILSAANASGVRGIVVCGRARIEPDRVEVQSLVKRFGEPRAMGDTRRALEDLCAEVATGFSDLP